MNSINLFRNIFVTDALISAATFFFAGFFGYRYWFYFSNLSKKRPQKV